MKSGTTSEPSNYSAPTTQHAATEPAHEERDDPALGQCAGPDQVAATKPAHEERDDVDRVAVAGVAETAATEPAHEERDDGIYSQRVAVLLPAAATEPAHEERDDVRGGARGGDPVDKPQRSPLMKSGTTQLEPLNGIVDGEAATEPAHEERDDLTWGFTSEPPVGRNGARS